jgi:hypothetical protein
VDKVSERVAASAGAIVIRPIDRVMGAEVLGADLSAPLSDADLQTFRNALHAQGAGVP